jgi:hypothetical protein
VWRAKIETAAVVHLTPGKMNAVRAAFKVGVKPSQIARQFGLPQADVRQALAGRWTDSTRQFRSKSATAYPRSFPTASPHGDVMPEPPGRKAAG